MEMKNVSKGIRQWIRKCIKSDPNMLGIAEEDIMSALHDAGDEGAFIDNLRSWFETIWDKAEVHYAFLDESLDNWMAGEQANANTRAQRSGQTVQFNMAYKGNKFRIDYVIDAPIKSHAVYDSFGKRVSGKIAKAILCTAQTMEKVGHFNYLPLKEETQWN